jgi:hypothetical protein
MVAITALKRLKAPCIYHLGAYLFMNTKLLELGEPIFEQIKKAVSEEKYQLAKSIIESTPPPNEWVVELPSRSRKGETYKTIPLDIMEGAVSIIFGEAGLKSISSPTITQDKSGKYAATVVVEYQYSSFDRPFMGYHTIPGVATVVAPSIELLELATPKASSMAVKNAIKQLGDLFGKSLNKSEDEVELPEHKEEEQATPEQLASQLTACTTIEDLKSYRLVVYAKGSPTELQELYETRLRSLKPKK